MLLSYRNEESYCRQSIGPNVHRLTRLTAAAAAAATLEDNDAGGTFMCSI